MDEVVQDVVQWIEILPPTWTYIALFVIAYGENVVPPIPGDIVIVFGGYLAGIGELNFFIVVLLSTLGGTAGFMSMYALGYLVGDSLRDPSRFSWLSTERIDKAERWLSRWGYGLVVANRFLSGLRSVISLTVGIARTNAPLTAAYCTLSAFVWTTLIVYGGYAVGENWQLVGRYLRDYGRVVFAVLGLILIVQTVRWYLKRYGSNSSGRE
ncbi:MAG: DedA family protein [Rhodothermales bacterium]